jgi:hypothetical protein
MHRQLEIYQLGISAGESKRIWDELVDGHFKAKPGSFKDRLKKNRFQRDGVFVKGKWYEYTKKHFPSLIKSYQSKIERLLNPDRAGSPA